MPAIFVPHDYWQIGSSYPKGVMPQLQIGVPGRSLPRLSRWSRFPEHVKCLTVSE